MSLLHTLSHADYSLGQKCDKTVTGVHTHCQNVTDMQYL